MEIIRFAELKAQPWRNGGGVTRELASHPLPASSRNSAEQDGGWDWRVSIADMSKANAFSAFPGMDRVLTVIDGELLLLTVGGAEHPLEKYRPFRFSGGADSAGTLPTGDIRGLFVITRQGAFKGYTSIIELSKKRAHPVFEGQFGILLQGQATVDPGTAGTEPGTDAGTGAGAAQGPGPARRRLPPPSSPEHLTVTTPSSARTPPRRKSWAGVSWPSCRSTRSLSSPSSFAAGYWNFASQRGRC